MDNNNIDKKENEDKKNNNFDENKDNQEEINIEENNNIKNENSNETIINTNNEIHKEVKDNKVKNIILNEEKYEIKLGLNFDNNKINFILDKNENKNDIIT